MAVFFLVPMNPCKPVKEISQDRYNSLLKRNGYLVGKIEGKRLFLYQKLIIKHNYNSVFMSEMQALQIIELLQKENKK